MTAIPTVSTESDAREAERPTWAGTYLRLASLLDRLPAPKSISFSPPHPDSLWIELDSVEAFDDWVLLMNARVSSRDKLIESGGGVQSHAYATWEGWAVYLQVVILVPAADEAVANDRHADHHARCTPEDCEEVQAQWRLAVKNAHDEGNHNACEPDDCEFGMAGLADAIKAKTFAEPSTDASQILAGLADKAAEAAGEGDAS